MSTPPIVVDAVEPFKRLYDFTKKHLLVINAVILFSGSVVAALDFLLPVLQPILVWVYVAIGVLAALMFLAAAFPVLWARNPAWTYRAPGIPANSWAARPSAKRPSVSMTRAMRRCWLRPARRQGPEGACDSDGPSLTGS